METPQFPTPTPETLLNALMVDIYKILGLSPRSFLCRPVAWLIRPPLLRFCKIFAETDCIMARDGFVDGARWLALSAFARDLHAREQAQVPEKGPLLVVSNHPGAIDSAAISACLGRQDLKIIASDVPFLKSLPTVSQHLIFIADDVHTRMSVIRQSIHHLKQGGALLVFPTGLIDPDPGFMNGAAQVMDTWSNSLEIFLRKVPGLQLLPVVASHVLHPAMIRSPFTRLYSERWKRQRIAEFLQFICQLFLPAWFVSRFRLRVEPRISFGRPYTLSELESNPAGVMLEVIRREKELLFEHEQAFQ